ncbi:hypothetical protein BD626DRAFT_391975 [Schizophyllum amplum]|uniref:Fungal-type protein kinase domain-containing protein n=1 Tax=Schizophyllum amplum TaxID=97359 RepID=A0A550CZ29_9AGAR|nr:hypothetical protein BD626DRAFT_391975 [Auriculariopsis ampla]
MGWRPPGLLETGIIESRLMMQGVLNEDGWTAFPSSPPRRTRSSQEIWAEMEDLVHAVVSAAEDRLPNRFSREARTTDFECRYSAEAYFDAGEADSVNIDGFTVLRETGPRGTKPGCASDKRVHGGHDHHRGPIYAADIGITVCWDAHRDEQARLQNFYSIMAVASYIFYNDRRRAYHLSITLEYTRARLWFHCRSHSVYSASFDINESYTEFIHFILFVIYANRQQMGFDPSVTRVVDAEDRLQYQFDICHTGEEIARTYQTISVLHEVAATADLHVRAMAVYLVRPATKGDGLSIAEDSALDRALRDFFQLMDQPDEQEARNHILGKMRGNAINETELRDCENFFVTVLADCEVPFDLCYVSPHRGKILDFVPRQRRRTLYGEVCEDMYDIQSARLFFFALTECCKILMFFLRVSSIHGDISPGNFLVHALRLLRALATDPDLWQSYSVKITDFEYSTDYDKLTAERGRTGTDYYMAVEVQAGCHLFYGEWTPPTLLARNHFSYNFYHDLESVLWMALHFALGHVSADVMRATEWETLSQWLWWQAEFMKLIFVRNGSEFREALMLGNMRECDRLQLVLERAYGTTSPMVRLVELIIAMGEAHRAVQSSQLDPDLVADPSAPEVPFKQLDKENFHGEIYCQMYNAFIDISECFTGEDGEVVPLGGLPAISPEDPQRLWDELDVVVPSEDEELLYELSSDDEGSDAEVAGEEITEEFSNEELHVFIAQEAAAAQRDAEEAPDESDVSLQTPIGVKNPAVPQLIVHETEKVLEPQEGSTAITGHVAHIPTSEESKEDIQITPVQPVMDNRRSRSANGVERANQRAREKENKPQVLLGKTQPTTISGQRNTSVKARTKKDSLTRPPWR